MNRVTAAIARQEANIQARTEKGLVDAAALARLDRTMDMELGEFARFQELKSIAMLEGRLTQDEAQAIYGYLGETTEHFNRQPLAVKVVLTQIFSELLRRPQVA